MHNQRILFSSRKERENNACFPGNKENNLKMFNHQVQDNSIGGSSNMAIMRYDYDGKRRMASRNSQLIPTSRECNDMLQSPVLADNKALDHNTRDLTPTLSSTPRLSQQQQQIQAYTNKLLQLNTLYQHQIVQLKQQLTTLRSQHEQSIAKSIMYRVNIQKKQQESSLQVNQQIESLVVELKEILAAKEQMQRQYNVYIEQLVEEHNNQIVNKTQQLAKAEQFFKQKLSSYKSTLTINNQQSQKLYFQASESKIKLIKQIDQLNYNLDREKGAKRQYQKSNEDLLKIVKQLEKHNTQIKQKLEVKQMDVFKIEKEKNQIIIHLKIQNKQLIEINTNLQQQLKSTNSILTTKTIQHTDNEKQLTIMTKQLQQVTKKLLQVNYQLQQQKRNKLKSEQVMTTKIENMARQLDKYQKLVTQLQTTIKRLSQDNTQNQSLLQHTQTQLTSANTQLHTLHQLQSQLTKQLSQLQDLNKKYKNDNIDLLQQLQLSNLQNKSLKQDKVNKDNQLNVLEQMCERLQSRLKTGDRRGQEEVGKLVEENDELKREIEFICIQYERKLQQTQTKWQNRLQTIQHQIQTLMQQKITTTRAQPINQPLIQPHERSNQRNRQLKSPMIIKNTNSLNQQQYLNSDKIKQNYFNDNLLTLQKQKIKYYQQAQKRLSEFRNSRRQ